MQKRVGKIQSIRSWVERTFLSTREKKLMCLGVFGAVLALVFGMGIFAAGIPWRGTADAPQHMDYAWQLWHGDIPNYWEGTKAPMKGAPAPIQFVSNHPPLYYALLAPIVGPLLDTGHWAMAVAAARAFSLMIGVLCVLALAWGGWVIGGKHRALFAIATPAIATSLMAFNVAGDIMNDGLNILFATIALTLSILVVQKGLKRNYVTGLVLVSLAGMATRASFMVTLFIVLLAVMIAAQLHSKGNFWRRLLPGIKVNAIIMTVVLVGIGWFYYHNYQLSGSPLRSRPAGSAQQLLNRPYKTLHDVVTMDATWEILTTGLYGRNWSILPTVAGEKINYWISAVMLTFIAICVALRTWRYRRAFTLISIISIGLLLLHFGLTYGQQIAYAVGYGGINRRYLTPAWLPFGLFLAAGALYVRRLRGSAVIVAATFGWLSIYVCVLNFLIVRTDVVASNPWKVLVIGVVEKNGLPYVVLPILVFGLLTGLSLQAVAMWKLTDKNFKASSTPTKRAKTA